MRSDCASFFNFETPKPAQSTQLVVLKEKILVVGSESTLSSFVLRQQAYLENLWPFGGGMPKIDLDAKGHFANLPRKLGSSFRASNVCAREAKQR